MLEVTMKIKYPIEAFALAMILFSKNMKEALITGILIVFLTTLGWVVKDCLGHIKLGLLRISVFISVMSVGYAVFQIVFIKIVPMEMNTTIMLLQLMIGLLIVKHLLTKDAEENVNVMLYESAIAFACFIVIGMIREFCAIGSIFGFKIADLSFMTENFQSIMIGFLFAGAALALVNAIIKKRVYSLNSLLVIVPVVLAFRPFELNDVGDIINFVIGIFIPIFIIVSIRYKLIFSSLGNAFKKLPIELISIGIVYMILTAF
jgi:hypothetical protein